jgi:hypothetical protein
MNRGEKDSWRKDYLPAMRTAITLKSKYHRVGLMVRDPAYETRLLTMRVQVATNNDLIPRRREAPSRGMD